MAQAEYTPQELVLLLVAVAARSVTNKVEIRSYKPLQVVPGLGGPKTLADVGIADDDRARIFKDALLTVTPGPVQDEVKKLDIKPGDKFSALRSLLEVIFFAAQFDQDN